MTELRKIIHIDMDAFYASIEQRDNPKLRGKPVAVGGSGNRGVVSAASYEARKYGVYSALASKIAKARCRDLIFVRPRFDVYKSVSKEIMDIFLEYTPMVEPLSLDEAFLDVTLNNKNNPSATLLAKEIKQQIKNKTKLIASAGVSTNKFLAKMASDVDKPDGLYVITPENAEQFVEQLPIEKFFGVGKKTAEKMRKMGILFGSDLKAQSLPFLVQHFGKVGTYFYGIARGIDNRPVNPNRIRKSFGREITFESDINNSEELTQKLNEIADELFQKIEQRVIRGRTLTLKIKYHDFEQITRSKTELHPIIEKKDFFSIAYELINHEEILTKPIRLLGLSVSNFIDNEHKEHIQLKIEFQNYHEE